MFADLGHFTVPAIQVNQTTHLPRLTENYPTQTYKKKKLEIEKGTA